MSNNPCLNCGFYDCDFGCTCPSIDRWYACPIEADPLPGDFVTKGSYNKQEKILGAKS